MTSVQPRYFGTDGIRGTFGESPLDVPFLRRLGYALASHLALQAAGRRVQVVIGRDPRTSGPEILTALAEGLLAGGQRVVDLGVVPTPVVPEMLLERHADFGVMITASHNPPTDNGVKFFDNNGLKLDDAAEAAIETWVDRTQAPEAPPRLPALETAEALESYRLLRMHLLPPNSLAGWVIAMDCGHGATCATTPEVFRRLGADVRARAVNPDGALINTDSGSEHPEHLAALVRASGARLGLAHDGDGDRLVVCDETGALVDGDELLGILALQALRTGKLKQSLVVATVQSNLGLDQALESAGGRVVRVPVGDRQVLHKLLELGAAFGGENSGHFIFADISRCGDGLLAALQLVRVLRETGRPLSALRKEIRLLPQRSANLRVRVKKPFAELPLFSESLRYAETTLRGRGRVLARYSGTEKKLRLLVEGPSPEELDMLLGALKLAAVRELGAA
jgi:phosphoglucosamine mutase